MDAVISAGGKGTRLGSLTREIPKALISVAGRAILAHQLEDLAASGISRVWLLTGHLGEAVENYVRSNRLPLEVELLREAQPLGTAGGLAALAGRIDESFVFVYGDLIFSVDFGRMAARHAQSGAAITLLAHPNSHPQDSDLIVADNAGRVLGIRGKAEARRGYYTNLVNAGAYILSPEVVGSLRPGVKSDFERDVVSRFIAGGRVFAYRTSEYVKDMGTPERLKQVEKDLERGVVADRRLSRRQRAVFLDRDGTVNRYVHLLHSPEQLELLPGAAGAIGRLNASGYLCFVVSNQPVVARNLCSMADVEETNRKLETLLGAEGAYLDDMRFCPHHPDSGYPGENAAYKIDCECRKPKTGMIDELAALYNVDLGRSYMVGDTSVDVQTAVNAGMRSILVKSGMAEEPKKYAATPGMTAADLAETVELILGPAGGLR